jgi:hypothetical protein
MPTRYFLGDHVSTYSWSAERLPDEGAGILEWRGGCQAHIGDFLVPCLFCPLSRAPWACICNSVGLVPLCRQQWLHTSNTTEHHQDLMVRSGREIVLDDEMP